jgi:transposase
MFERRKKRVEQQEFWISRQEIAPPRAAGFYQKLDATLRKHHFSEQVWKLCKPAYADLSKGGRPGIDPVVYFKMQMVGFFEDLPSQRAISSRCDDSRAIREFLGYDLTEATPEQSSFTVIRQRLPLETIQAVHEVVLQMLREHGLLKGRRLGIDSSVIEANASLRALENRNSEESYWDYVKRLAAEAGIDPEDTKAVRRFDKKRPDRKTSNEEWHNPHDPDAKVGRTKDGATDMIYKPEHVSDLESGAIVRAEVRLGNEGDTQDLSERVADTLATLEKVCGEENAHILGKELGGDEGYFALQEVGRLQEMGVRVVISDPLGGRRRPDLPEEERQILRRANRALKSASGKALLRRRGEFLERGFCHVLDHGGCRRATLRGKDNLNKRYLGAVLTYNLSVLLRKVHGCGTAKQWVAGGLGSLQRALCALLSKLTWSHLPPWAASKSKLADWMSLSSLLPQFAMLPENWTFSTGC